jgi:lysophospholipase L1-like esterase
MIRIKRKRLAVICVSGLVLVMAGAAYLYLWCSIPIGRGPAGPIVSGESFSHQWTDRPVLLVGMGDSVTAGFGARKGYSYFDRLVQNPLDEFQNMSGICLGKVLPKLAFTNLAISGSTSTELLENELPHLTQAESNIFGIVVITTGGNDLIHNYGRTPPREEAMYGATFEEAQPWISNYELRLESMVQKIEAQFPGGCRIFLANIYDPTDGIGDTERARLPAWKDSLKTLAAYNDAISRCVQKNPNLHVIDIHSAFLGHGIHCTQFWRSHYDWQDPHYWFYDNLEDPNERGYDVIRRLFLIEIAKAFKQSTVTGTI